MVTEHATVSRKIKSIKRKPAEPVYDIQVKKNHNFFANSILVHNCLIFQESVMELAEKCAGFPKEKCDEVRRAIMKRSISGGSAAQKVAQETRDGFVQGCVKNGYTEKVANNLYDKILFFAGYGFNKSHAVAYAIDSYWCAWLMTYYEEQWLSAYLESMSNSPVNKAKAFGEVKAMGYQIVPIDVNIAGLWWKVLPGKKLMPSITSVKGCGDTAVEEIIEMRPFKSIEEMLYNDDGTWKLSKFNKKSMEALIKIRAFDSLDCVGEDKLFKSYRHMHETMMGSYVEILPKKKGSDEMVERVREHSQLIKRSPKADEYEGMKNLYEIARKVSETHSEEWTRRELVEFQSEVFGTADLTAMFDHDIMDKLSKKGVSCIEDLEAGQEDVAWFITVAAPAKKGGKPIAGTLKTTKNGKTYVQAYVTGVVGKPLRMNVWGGKELFEPFKLYVGQVKRDDYGLSTTVWKVKEVA